VLHDIGIQAAERRHGSGAGRFQEQEGVPIARRILGEIGFDESTAAHVCRIVAHHHSGGCDTAEFRVVWDADNLVNAAAESAVEDPTRIRRRLDSVLKTAAGRRLAERMFGT
jgi:hypothetical protein